MISSYFTYTIFRVFFQFLLPLFHKSVEGKCLGVSRSSTYQQSAPTCSSLCWNSLCQKCTKRLIFYSSNSHGCSHWLGVNYSIKLCKLSCDFETHPVSNV